MVKWLWVLAIAVLFPLQSKTQVRAPQFKRVITVIFENETFSSTMNVPEFANFAKAGATLSNFYAVTHPSQPNYIAMVSGSTYGVNHDGEANLNGRTIADLLEKNKLTWRAYAEDYPGNCFKGMSSGDYARKHVPFLSFVNISGAPNRCSNITDLKKFFADWSTNQLPHYSYVVPNLKSDGHDTGVKFAGQWFMKNFGQYLSDPKLMQDTLFAVTFDEGTYLNNKIYTVFYGPMVKPGAMSSARYDHYSFLRTIEDQWALGTLGLEDAKATAVKGIWKSDQF